MKIITLNESQFGRLFEREMIDGDDTTSRLGSEVSNQAIINDPNGEEEWSTPIDTDDFADMQTPQQWGSVGGRKSSNTI